MDITQGQQIILWLERAVDIFGPLTIFSVVGMFLHLQFKSKKLLGYEYWLFFPYIIAEYRRVNKSRSGKSGILFHIFIISFIFILLTFPALFIFSFKYGPVYIQK
jgi:hypothetical protein